MKRSPLGVIFFTITLDLIGFGMVIPLMPLYAQRFEARATAVAWLFASYSWMQFVCAPIWGRLSDRLGRRPILLISICGNALSMLAFGLAPTYVFLLGARLLAGVCSANISVAHAYIADVTSPQERAKGMGLVGAAFGMGFVIGPFVGGELSRWGAAVPALVAAALGGLNGLSAWLWLPESLPERFKAAPRDAPRVTPFPWGWTVFFGKKLGLKFRDVGPVLCLIFLQVLGFSMLEMALVLFANKRLHFDSKACGRLLAYMGVVLTVVQGGLMGRLVRRFGERRLVHAGLVGVGVGMAWVPATPVGGWMFLAGILALVSVGQGMLTPSLNSLLSRLAPSQVQGALLGWGQSLASLARALGPQIAGLVFDWVGENGPFFSGALLMTLAWGVASWYLSPAIP